MDAETLNIILKLKEENTLFKRALRDACSMILSDCKCMIIRYDIPEIDRLFNRIIDEFKEKEQKKPAENADNPNNSAQQLP